MVGLRTSWSRLSAQRLLQKRSRWNTQIIRNGSSFNFQVFPSALNSQRCCRLCCATYYKRDMCNRSFPPIMREEASQESLSISAEDENAENLFIMDNKELILDSDIDDHDMSHLRIKLYRLDESDPQSESISRLYEAASVQEVFDIISSVPEINYSPKIASQALVTLWDIQKLLFKLGPIFNPEEDIRNKSGFIESIKANQIFKDRVLRPVLDMHQELEDEPLCASLLALKKMEYSIVVIEALIDECIRRNRSGQGLALAGLSRLSVVLRSRGLYGQLIMGEFSPTIFEYVNQMNDDLEVRLVSILLRNSNRIISETIFKAYATRLNTLLDTTNFETITYCKMFIFLLDSGKLAPLELIHKVSYKIKDRASDIELMELLSLQKYLSGSLPWPLIEALMSRASRVIEECQDRPRIDLVSYVGTFMRGPSVKKRLAQITNDCIDNNDFATIQNVLYPLIRSLKTDDRTIYDKYWNNAVNLLEQELVRNPQEYKRSIYLAKNYLHFAHSLTFSYRNSWLETICKKQLYKVLDRYLKDPPDVVISPSEFATIISFLIAFDQSYLDLKYISKLEQFVKNMKALDIGFIVKGLDCALSKVIKSGRNPTLLNRKSYEIVSEACSILEEECALRFVRPNTDVDLSMVWKVLSVIRRMKGDSPLLDVGMKAFTSMGKDSYDSREIREACSALISGSYLYPEAMDMISSYVTENLEHANPETIDKFLNLTYSLGWEDENVDFGKLASVIESNADRFGLGIIQSGLSLGFHHQLRRELIDKIFNVEFLDYIDEEIQNTYGKNNQYPFRLRVNLMELNRIACLDVPNARLPWFHEKFCQNIIAQGHPKQSYLHDEVHSNLTDLLGEGAVQSNVCLPHDYYYNIDFVIKFDHDDRPIRVTSRPRTLSFSPIRKDHPDNVKRKVAILVLSNVAFTKNVRQIKGGYKLKKRHLEILGYEVFTINPFKWNSMYMSELSVKQQFLESKIFNLNK